jgi:hypothetical protein
LPWLHSFSLIEAAVVRADITCISLKREVQKIRQQRTDEASLGPLDSSWMKPEF